MVDNQKTQHLEVYLLDWHVGKLSSNNNTLSFAYDDGYLNKEDSVKLSASLPLQKEPFEHQVSHAFFSGLLPDESVRYRLARYLRISEKNSFALLKEIGGECAGAISLYPEGKTPEDTSNGKYRVLEEDEAEEALNSLETRPLLAGDGDIRISGAGAQNKLMIAFKESKFAIPLRGALSTHIIKPAIKDLKEPVHNEFFCMSLAERVGFNVPKVDIYWLKDKPYYLVERYDRIKDESGNVSRLHQEDFCQALKLAPEMKYQREGGPTINQCFELLDGRIKSGAMPGVNKIALLKAVIFNFLIGNGDAHGKNFSLLYEGEAESLSPLYDLMCTVIYAEAFKSRMAMKIGGKYKFNEISIYHFDKLAEEIGFKKEFVREKVIKNLVKETSKQSVKLVEELNKDKKTQSPIYEEILMLINKHSEKLLNQLSS